MFLTRFFLQRDLRRVRADVADPESLHKTVMRLFPSNAGPEARKEHGVLHRLDENGSALLLLLVQSRIRPDVSALPHGYIVDPLRDPELGSLGIEENPSIRNVTVERAAIRSGDRFLFRLKANTTRKILTKSTLDGQRNNGKRVPVRGEAARIEWLERRSEAAGFACDDFRVSEVPVKGHGASGVRVAGAVFDGILQVKDLARFLAALESGIGPAKAYGFGLLSIRRMT